jgi:ABC-type glycerol-3-phosphate transport system substrate-binding protein
MNKPIYPYPRPKNRCAAALLLLLAATGLAGCAAQTTATVNRDITTVIAGAGAAANQAETDYQNKVIAQTPAARTAINGLGAAYEKARQAYQVYLQAVAAYQAAEGLQLGACEPQSGTPGGPGGGSPASCQQATSRAQTAATQMQNANAGLTTAVSGLSTQIKAVQALKK